VSTGWLAKRRICFAKWRPASFRCSGPLPTSTPFVDDWRHIALALGARAG
jgi:hypothetical protein